jgi:hypothetical protein
VIICVIFFLGCAMVMYVMECVMCKCNALFAVWQHPIQFLVSYCRGHCSLYQLLLCKIAVLFSSCGVHCTVPVFLILNVINNSSNPISHSFRPIVPTFFSWIKSYKKLFSNNFKNIYSFMMISGILFTSPSFS